MSNTFKYILTLFFVLMLLSACRKDRFEDAKNKDYGFGYYPLKPGGFKLYEGVRIVYNPFFNNIDTSYFLLKEEYDSLFLDNRGRPALRIHHTEKHPDSVNWQDTKVLYDVIATGFVERILDNIRTVKLSFPISDEIIWNINIRNDKNEWLVFYEKLYEPFRINGLDFDSTVTVTMTPEITLFENKTYKEIFAKDVGMIFSEYSDVELQNNKFAGTKLKLTLLNYAY